MTNEEKIIKLEEKIEKLKESKKKLKEKNEKLKEENKELKKKISASVNDIVIGDDPIDASSIGPLTREVKKAISVSNFGKQELRFIVDRYYDIQEKRIELSNQIFAIENGENISEEEKCHELLDWELSIYKVLEQGYKQAMETASTSNRSGRWLRSIKGIGPALAATLEAYLDINKAAHRNAFVQYAGLNDNNRPWLGRDKSKAIVEEETSYLTYNEVIDILQDFNLNTSELDFIEKDRMKIIYKDDFISFLKSYNCDNSLIKQLVGDNSTVTYNELERIAIRSKWKVTHLEEKCKEEINGKIVYNKQKLISACAQIPYNKKLKTAVWKIGEQLVKVSNKPDSLYGRMYKERKAYEIEKNQNGDYAEQAKKILETTNIQNKDIIEINKSGMLTKGHIEARAKRYAVTMLLNHYFEACYYYKHGKKAPDPYAITFLGHEEYIGPEVAYEDVK